MAEIYWVITTYGQEPDFPSLGRKRFYYTAKEYTGELSPFYKDYHFKHGIYPLYSPDFRDAYLFTSPESAEEELEQLMGLLDHSWEVREVRIHME